MNRIIDCFREFRQSRLGSILASVLFILVGLYGLFIEMSVVEHMFGVLFLIIGLLGFYKQFISKSLVDTIKQTF